MKITVNTKEIQTALKNLLKVAPNKSSITALNNNIKLNVREDYAELIASDTTVTVTLKLKDVEIIETGSIVITKDTIKLISKLTDNNMTITYNNIESGKRNVTYKGIVPEVYPAQHDGRIYNEHAFTLSKEKMFDIQSITYACSTSESQYILQGLHFKDNIVTACDRHRLATRKIDNNNLTYDMIIPSYAIDYIPMFTDKNYKGEYTFDVENGRYVRITFDNVTMEIYLTVGNYPNTSKIIPQSFVTEVKVNKNQLIEELKVLREVTNDKLKIVKMNITDTFKLSAESDNNTLTSELDSFIIGDTLNIAANIDYILDALKVNNNEMVTIKFTGKRSPFMIDDEALILPYKTAESNAA